MCAYICLYIRILIFSLFTINHRIREACEYLCIYVPVYVYICDMLYGVLCYLSIMESDTMVEDFTKVNI